MPTMLTNEIRSAEDDGLDAQEVLDRALASGDQEAVSIAIRMLEDARQRWAYAKGIDTAA